MSTLTSTNQIVDKQVSIIRCGVGRQVFGIEMNNLLGLERSARVIRSQQSDGSLGMLPWNHEELPVFSLADLLDLKSPSSGQQVLVLRDGEQKFALVVDQVSQVEHYASDRIKPLPGIVLQGAAKDFLSGLVLGEKPMLLLKLQMSGAESAETRSIKSRGYRDANRNASASVGQGSSRVMMFTVAPASTERSVIFGLSMQQVVEVMSIPDLLNVPLEDDYLHGLMVWRDEPIPVVDPAKHIGLSQVQSKGCTRVLIARDRLNRLIGFAIRPAIRNAQLPIPCHVAESKVECDSEFVLGQVELTHSSMLLLNVERMLSH